MDDMLLDRWEICTLKNGNLTFSSLFYIIFILVLRFRNEACLPLCLILSSNYFGWLFLNSSRNSFLAFIAQRSSTNSESPWYLYGLPHSTERSCLIYIYQFINEKKYRTDESFFSESADESLFTSNLTGSLKVQ